MKEIPLTRGKVAIIDDDDFRRIKQSKWHYTNRGFAATRKRIGNKKHYIIYMHRLIIDAPPGIQVYHKNRNKLDNRKENLILKTDRDVEKEDNKSIFQHKVKRLGTSSQYKGVTLNKRNKKWYAQIRVKNKVLHIGHSYCEEEAAIMYDRAAKEHFGAFAVLNFPDEVKEE